jgi:hypothetical protein
LRALFHCALYTSGMGEDVDKRFGVYGGDSIMLAG